MSKQWSGVNRRELIGGAVAFGLTAPLMAYAKLQKRQKAQVVVVGGGYGGVTTAKYLKKENPNLDVVLIEERPFFMSCPMSNHFLTGLMELTPLCFSYNVLETRYGVRVINDKILGVELDKKAVRTSSGYIAYDYLVLSPGIDYDVEDKPFYKDSLVYNPPAFKPGSEHIYLKRLIEDFEVGDILITVPPPPYRCPPAPYERAALIASMIKKNKLKAHIYFIDANERPIINSEGFLSAYYDLYKDIATYITSAQVRDIDVHKRMVKTSHGDFKYDLANIIPPMKANSLLEKTGLLRKGQKWVEVNPLTFESSVKNVFVIGDACQSYLPKSGYAAHSEGKMVAKIINARMKGKEVKEEYLQMICYAMVSDKEAIMTETAFRYDTVSKRFVPTHREDNQRKESTAKRYEEWARGLWRDLFS
ncbi:FAD/NAD(P)-binding oxidoreductase [Hydrogenobacter sp. T-2]|uniref:FAD/NAD(P)-binding oxidoreductase n=1 Tax=Pampinifervens diazotrophicum TaxID=1632018 RepID=UPI002B258C7F|nr:FAD/NAD(P)-binding oxidoreductase [Hydrogenobacter sp. T-2]WPM31384.1 FAD/NAD(P)-binding oxidoreductase [Hydrogenobacter sp. T-2]